MITPWTILPAVVETSDVREAVVRMIVHTKPELEPLIDDKACRQLLADAFYVAAVIRDVERLDRIRFGQDSSVEALTPHDLLVRYFEHKEVARDRAKLLLEYADRLMIADSD